MTLASCFSKRLKIILTSADINVSLHKISDLQIDIRDIEYLDAFRIRFSVSAKTYDSLRALCENRGDRIEITEKYGLLPLIFVIRSRMVLIAGLALICLLSALLSTRILFVRVEGNVSVSSKLILEQAQKCGLRFGIKSKNVRSDYIKSHLLTTIPQLQWAGINTLGCTATISVREGTDQSISHPSAGRLYIVAAQDAVVREMTVLEGTAQCSVGEKVSQGQILISPYTDCGLCIRVTNAKGEIIGDTERKWTTIFPVEYQQKTKIVRQKKKLSLIIGKKRINFCKGSGISGSTCAKIYEENYVKLPGGFVLPIGIIREEYVEYEHQAVRIESDSSALKAAAEEYLLTTMYAGSIRQADHILSSGSQACRLDSVFSCYELIGISVPEEDITKDE